MAVYSCIGYPGSKRKCIDLIMDTIPDGITDWREPFFGSGSVTLGFLQSSKSKDCKKFIVGDLAPEIWALWAGIQRDEKAVVNNVEKFWREHIKSYDESLMYGIDPEIDKELADRNRAEADAFWKWTQEVDTKGMTLEERAARTWLANRVSFSSMGDSGSLSYDNFKKFRLEHTQKILDMAPFLKRLEILNAPFTETMKDVPEEGGFIFLDPPYMNQEKSGLYGKNGDTHHGFPHQGFADLCKKTKAKWLVTYDDSIGVRKLFRGRGIYIQPFQITYTMAGKAAEDALAGEELFIANYDITTKKNDLASIL